jgi:alginate lyase
MMSMSSGGCVHDAFAAVCQILSAPADNLWTYELPDGRRMRKAMEFMFPYIADTSRWPLKPDVQY